MTTIPNLIVISEELAKNSPEITRLPKMGPTQWHCDYREPNVIASTIIDQWEQNFNHELIEKVTISRLSTTKTVWSNS